MVRYVQSCPTNLFLFELVVKQRNYKKRYWHYFDIKYCIGKGRGFFGALVGPGPKLPKIEIVFVPQEYTRN